MRDHDFKVKILERRNTTKNKDVKMKRR